MDYKSFFIWMDGFMTNRDWTTIRQIDIETIKLKMSEVKDKDSFDLNKLNSLRKNSPFNPVVLPLVDNDETDKPTKIVM